MRHTLLFLSIAGFSCLNFAQANTDEIETVTVEGRQYNLLGEALSASEGIIGQHEIKQRPMLRTGEVLEFVPGMVVTQHSGSGKANQYFLRGFNLDHGTDFRTSIDGMPVNKRSHGHGQGYTDLSFIIPELVDRIIYEKGPYHSEHGDFSTAGSAHFRLADKIAEPFISFELGENAYQRSVAAANIGTGEGHLLLGMELQQYDGPWSDINEDVDKQNFLARYSQKLDDGYLAFSLMAYSNEWNAADQIPQRAVEQGLIHRLGSLDKNVGGDSSRYSLSAQWQSGNWAANAYAIDYELDLFSNFTYLLDNPSTGDQFKQEDKRRIYGGEIKTQLSSLDLGDMRLDQFTGVQVQHDDIANVGLYRSQHRLKTSTIRQDSIKETSLAWFWRSELMITSRLSAKLGLRYDHLSVDVNSHIDANSGKESDGISSFKAGLSYRLNSHWELYANAGQSFHSNDARGATIAVDPASGDPADKVDLLIRGEGAELGLRFYDDEHWNISLAAWVLELDSELVFVGDAGNTEASRGSRRQGLELAAYYWLDEKLSVDVELAWTHSRFTETATDEGDYIEGSLPFVASAGIHYQFTPEIAANIRLRHFGKRALDSYKTQESDNFTVINMGLDYHYQQWQLGLDLLNVFDSQDHDIEYFYASRLAGEGSDGVEDKHYHPIEPRTARVKLQYHF